MSGNQLGLDGVDTLALDPKLSQWFTPPRLARKVGDWALEAFDGRPLRVLEPAAGSGRLIAPLVGCGQIVAHEIDARWVTFLEEHFPSVDVRHSDYLAAPAPSEPYDVAPMNPPYEGGLDGRFVAKAMDESLRVIAVLRTVALNGKKRHDAVWSRITAGEWRMTRIAYLVERPDYGGDIGAKADFCVVKLSRVATDPAFGPEWWTGPWERGAAP